MVTYTYSGTDSNGNDIEASGFIQGVPADLFEPDRFNNLLDRISANMREALTVNGQLSPHLRAHSFHTLTLKADHDGQQFTLIRRATP